MQAILNLARWARDSFKILVSILSSLFQILGVALVAFMVLVPLASYLRYRKMYLQATDQSEDSLTASAAGLRILSALRKKNSQMGLVRIVPEPLDQPDTLVEVLRKNVRSEDEIFRLINGHILICFRCPAEHLACAGRRMIPVLEEAGVSAGEISLFVPDVESFSFFEWMERKVDEPIGPQWKVIPKDWERFEPEPGMSVSVDELTGVLKPDRVMRAIRRLLAAQRRFGGQVSLVLLDIDQLESYNKSYGRETGDQMLKQTASLLMKNCRETDLIGRIEEDSFVIAMVGDPSDLLTAVRRMSDCLKNSTLDTGEESIRYSAGFGMASMPADGRNPVLLLERAEWAMQEAKRRGRGICVAYQPSLTPQTPAAVPGENRPESF